MEGDDESGVEKRAAIFIGPEFGTVSRPDLVSAAREAGDAGFDVLIACASSLCTVEDGSLPKSHGLSISPPNTFVTSSDLTKRASPALASTKCMTAFHESWSRLSR